MRVEAVSVNPVDAKVPLGTATQRLRPISADTPRAAHRMVEESAIIGKVVLAADSVLEF